MPNLTKKPGRRELAARVCKLASLSQFTEKQFNFTRRQLAELVLYLENTHNLLTQMKERLYGKEETDDKTG